MKEVWKYIPGFNNLYMVSNKGNLKSYARNKRGRILCKTPSSNGYYTVKINNKTKYIHRLVAEVFIPNLNKKPQVNHKDCNKLNNNVENLEWCTRKENAQHAIKNDRYFFGENNSSSKITSTDIVNIRLLYMLGVSQGILSNYYGISQSNLSYIVLGETWVNIDIPEKYIKRVSFLSDNYKSYKHIMRRRGESHHKTRFSKNDVLKIRSLYENGTTQTEIANIYNTRQGVISNIVLRKTWRHI